MKKYYLLLCCLVLVILVGKAQYTVLHSFNGAEGANPWGSVTLSENKLYGMTHFGGMYNYGCIFSIDTSGAAYKVFLNFDSISNGSYPCGDLTISGKVLYGMTNGGGSNGFGTIFSIDTSGSNYKCLLNFDSINGAYPEGSLTLLGSKLYGMTSFGGIGYGLGYGTIFSIDTNGSSYKKLLNLADTNGDLPQATTLTASGKVLYGMTYWGGGQGDIFSIDTNGNNDKHIFDFSNSPFESPYGSLTLAGNKLYGMVFRDGAAGGGGGAVFSIDTDGEAFDTLLGFKGINGADAYGSLTLSGRTLYGMTNLGGTDDSGVIFSVDTNGTNYRKLLNFNGINGANPVGTSLKISGNILYGMTSMGGLYHNGVIFKIDTPAIASINQLATTNGKIDVYPNPNNGMFTLQIENYKLGIKDIRVYNVLGESIYETKVNSNSIEINLSEQPEGIYLYRVTAPNGDLLGEGKIIITH